MEYTENDKINIIRDYNNGIKLMDIGKKYQTMKLGKLLDETH